MEQMPGSYNGSISDEKAWELVREYISNRQECDKKDAYGRNPGGPKIRKFRKNAQEVDPLDYTE